MTPATLVVLQQAESLLVQRLESLERQISAAQFPVGDDVWSNLHEFLGSLAAVLSHLPASQASKSTRTPHKRKGATP